jgi:hypothetical protein
MMPTSNELLALARACADRVDLSPKLRRYPSFSEIEEQCEGEYDALLEAMHQDEVFETVDLDRQQQLVEAITAALPAEARGLVEELVDNHARHAWLQQEGAYYIGLALGLRAQNVTSS